MGWFLPIVTSGLGALIISQGLLPMQSDPSACAVHSIHSIKILLMMPSYVCEYGCTYRTTLHVVYTLAMLYSNSRANNTIGTQ